MPNIHCAKNPVCDSDPETGYRCPPLQAGPGPWLNVIPGEPGVTVLEVRARGLVHSYTHLKPGEHDVHWDGMITHAFPIDHAFIVQLERRLYKKLRTGPDLVFQVAFAGGRCCVVKRLS